MSMASLTFIELESIEGAAYGREPDAGLQDDCVAGAGVRGHLTPTRNITLALHPSPNPNTSLTPIAGQRGGGGALLGRGGAL